MTDEELIGLLRDECEKDKDDCGEDTYRVFLDDEEMVEWWDGANVSQPEDLTWCRSIKSVFHDGVRAGLKLAGRRGK